LAAECRGNVRILGAGRMGMGLAIWCAQCGFSIRMHTRRDPSQVSAALGTELARLASRLSEEGVDVECVRQRVLALPYEPDDWAPEIVLEAVAEQPDAKRWALATVPQLSVGCPSVASTTSALSVRDLSLYAPDPTRFLGLHFFNPVARMQLVEVVSGSCTSADAMRAALDFVHRLGKTPVAVADSPGFIVNRLLLLQINAATRLVEEGVSSPPSIDQAMQLGAGHPMGPLSLGDYIGWDVVLSALEAIHRRTGDTAYIPSELIRSLVHQGRLGRKTGAGLILIDNAVDGIPRGAQ
jgi:3-hydroxybutyryl-CoA dehydrogenase